MVDKTLNNFFFLPLVALAFPDAKIVHITRDPVDTILSIYQQFFDNSMHPYGAYGITERPRQIEERSSNTRPSVCQSHR